MLTDRPEITHLCISVYWWLNIHVISPLSCIFCCPGVPTQQVSLCISLISLISLTLTLTLLYCFWSNYIRICFHVAVSGAFRCTEDREETYTKEHPQNVEFVPIYMLF